MSNKGGFDVYEDILMLVEGFIKHKKPKSLAEITTLKPTFINNINLDTQKNIFKLPSNFLDETVLDLSNEWSKKVDTIVGIIPFGFKNNVKDPIESKIIKNALQKLNHDGILIALLPYIFTLSPRFEVIRKEIITKYSLDAIIDIPTKRFAAYTNVKMVLLIVRKGSSSKKCYMGRLGSEPQIQIESFKNGTGSYWIDYSKLVNRIDREFHHPKHNDLKKYLVDSETSRIEELAEVKLGRPAILKYSSYDETDYPIITRRNIQEGKLVIDERTKYLKEECFDSKYKNTLLQEGDIIVSIDFKLGTLYSYKKEDPKALLGQGLALLRPFGASGEYIKSYLSFKEGRKIFEKQVDMESIGSVVKKLPISALKSIQIPIVPLDSMSLDKISDKNIDSADKGELIEIKAELARVLQTIEDKSSKILEFSKNRFNRVDGKLEIIESKVDEVVKSIKELEAKLERIKGQPREEEEKLRKIYRLIDKKLEKLIDNKSIDDYIEDIKDWFEYWDFLDEASKTFLPSAEYLFDEIHHVGAEDYSPFIIQYCRALENELLKKLFESYHIDIMNRLSKDDIKNITELEFEKEGSKTLVFAKFVAKDDRKYTMGQMNWILNLAKANGSTLKSSPLLQDFRKFVLKYYENMVLEKAYLNKISKITTEFRNKSAHPYVMGLDIAKECQILVRDGLNYFFENKK